MINLDIQSLLEHLRQQNYDAQIQTATRQIVIILNIIGKQFPLFIKVDDAGKILQLITIMPCTINPKVTADVARFLHLINKEIDLPGFGMDEAAGVIFFRCVLPTTEGELDPELLKVIMQSIPRIAESFFSLIATIAQGTSNFETVASKTREALRKFSQQR